MSQKISLYIGSRKFDVDVDDEFAKFLEKQMLDDFNVEGNNDSKTILQAYVKRSHELYVQNKKIEEILQNIEE